MTTTEGNGEVATELTREEDQPSTNGPSSGVTTVVGDTDLASVEAQVSGTAPDVPPLELAGSSDSQQHEQQGEQSVAATEEQDSSVTKEQQTSETATNTTKAQDREVNNSEAVAGKCL